MVANNRSRKRTVYKDPVCVRNSSYVSSIFSLTQILTGHGKFPFYISRFEVTDNSNCFCGMDTHNFAHYFNTCPWTLFFRNKLRQLKYNDFTNSIKSAMPTKTKAITILEHMMIFIQDEMNSR